MQVFVHRLSPGMVTTELLMSGADNPRSNWFINALAEPAELVAENLVPRVRREVSSERMRATRFVCAHRCPLSVPLTTPPSQSTTTTHSTNSRRRQPRPGQPRPRQPRPRPFSSPSLQIRAVPAEMRAVVEASTSSAAAAGLPSLSSLTAKRQADVRFLTSSGAFRKIFERAVLQKRKDRFVKEDI